MQVSSLILRHRVVTCNWFGQSTLLTMLLILFALPMGAHAQTYFGAIVGNRAKDSTGAAVVANAKVTVTNTVRAGTRVRQRHRQYGHDQQRSRGLSRFLNWLSVRMKSEYRQSTS